MLVSCLVFEIEVAEQPVKQIEDAVPWSICTIRWVSSNPSSKISYLLTRSKDSARFVSDHDVNQHASVHNRQAQLGVSTPSIVRDALNSYLSSMRRPRRVIVNHEDILYAENQQKLATG